MITFDTLTGDMASQEVVRVPYPHHGLKEGMSEDQKRRALDAWLNKVHSE